MFHGSLESFTGGLKPGGDGLIWFTDSPKIAQLYIPQSGGEMALNERSLQRPSQDQTIQELQKMIGIEYDTSKVKWGPGGQANSFSGPKGWDHLPTEEDINGLMKKYGFEKDDHDLYRIRTHHGKILKPNTKVKGRLFIARVKKPLSIYKKAMGEGDLTDVQYNDLSTFKKVEEVGYDGILIDDFAQSKEWGNFGHLSVGVFDDKKISVHDIPAEYQEYDRETRGTPEYPNPPPTYFHKL